VVVCRINSSVSDPSWSTADHSDT